MDEFHDVSFPLRLALGSRGGPVRSTTIVRTGSGREVRSQRQYHSRRRYDAALGVRTIADARELTAFFEARRGRMHAFRFRDPFDHSSNRSGEPQADDQLLGVGDAATTQFQIMLHYGALPDRYARKITKPSEGSVSVALDSVPMPTSEFITDVLTGIITLSSAPPVGTVVTAGFVFDVPVRFDTDELLLTAEGTGAEPVDVPLVEVLE